MWQMVAKIRLQYVESEYPKDMDVKNKRKNNNCKQKSFASSAGGGVSESLLHKHIWYHFQTIMDDRVDDNEICLVQMQDPVIL